ncbi:MAG: glycosyltransferase family 4 protein [Caldilineaceae bacterium]
MQIQGAVGFGGAERHTLQLALGLHARPDFRVSVVGPYHNNPEMHRRLCDAEIARYDVDLADKRGIAETLYRLASVVRRENVDLIHTHIRNADMVGILVGTATRRPVIATIHGRTGPLWGDHVPLRSATIKWLHSRLLRYGTRRIVAISHFIKQFSMEDLHLPAHKFAVIHNASGAEAAPSVDLSALRQNLHLPADAPIVSLIGGLTRQKGAHHFLHMAQLVLGQIPNAHFLVVGEGDREDELKALAQSLGLAGAVHFTGKRNDVPALLQLTSVLAMTARDEGFGRVITEAMAARRPVIAFAHGAIPEIVAHEESGYLIPYADVPLLAQQMVALLNDPERQQAMGEAGRRRLLSHFSTERFVSATAQLIHDVVRS